MKTFEQHPAKSDVEELRARIESANTVEEIKAFHPDLYQILRDIDLLIEQRDHARRIAVEAMQNQGFYSETAITPGERYTEIQALVDQWKREGLDVESI